MSQSSFINTSAQLIYPNFSNITSHALSVISESPFLPNSSVAATLDATTAPSEPTTTTRDTSADNIRLSMLNYWINGVITNLVVFLGLIGNSLTVLILSRRVMRSSTNYYLGALAIWDTVVLICTALLIGIPGTRAEWYTKYVFAYVVSYMYPLALSAQTATIWLTVSFTVERYIAVCHPLRAASMCTIHRAKLVIVCVSIGASLYNLPRWFDYQPLKVTEVDTTGNITYIELGRTAFSRNPVYLQIYLSWLYVPIMCIIPLVLLSVLNTFLILAVRKSKKQQQDMNVKQSRENNVTIMLVSVVVVFIICQVPALVYNLAYAINNTYVDESYGYKVLSTIRNFLVNLNSAVNFLLYCAFGQKFRRIFIHTFCRHCEPENYIPMSGVSQQTMIQVTPMRKGMGRGQNDRVLFSYRVNNATTSSASPAMPIHNPHTRCSNNNCSPRPLGRHGYNGMVYKPHDQHRNYLAMRPLPKHDYVVDSDDEVTHETDEAPDRGLVSPMHGGCTGRSKHRPTQSLVP